MPRRCTICEHPQRDEIDAAVIARAESYRGISRRFRVSEDALARHAAAHVPATLIKAREAEEATRADDLLAQVRELQGRAMAILGVAEQAGDLKTALAAIREARGCLELLAKLLGELQEGATVNIVLSPQWVQVRTVIIAALGPYPEARLAVAEALRDVGA